MKKILQVVVLPTLAFILALFFLSDWAASTVFFMLPLYSLIAAKGRVLFANTLLLLGGASFLLSLGITETFILSVGILILGATLPPRRKRKAIDPSLVSNPNLNPYSTGGRGLGAV